MDCNNACFDESSDHSPWCVGFEFLTSTPGAGTRPYTSTCRLFEACGEDSGDAPMPSPTAAVVRTGAASATTEETSATFTGEPYPGQQLCMRIADQDFDQWFITEIPSRTATEIDCSHACTNEDSEHHSWCIGYKFIASTKGTKDRRFSSTCQLFEDCTQSGDNATETSLSAPVVREAVSRASLPKKNVFSAERCLRKSDTDFDRWSAGWKRPLSCSTTPPHPFCPPGASWGSRRSFVPQSAA